jgi:ATP-binding cassette, subfamily B, bacterial AbcA/BmrA
MAKEKIKSENGVWKPFLKMLWKAKLPWIWVIITFALSMGGSALQLMFPDYTEQVIGGDLSRNTIIIFVVVMIATAAVNIASSGLQGIADAKINRKMRRSVWNILTALPVERLDESGAKELISRNTTDTNSVSNIFSSTLPGMISTLYYVIGSLISVSDYALSMSMIMLAVVVANLILTVVSGAIVYGLNNKKQTKLAELTEQVAEVMSNIPLVKIFTAENREKARGRKAIEGYQKASFVAQTTSNAFYYTASLVNLIGTMVVIVYGGVMVNKGVIDIGAWVAYFMYYYYLAMDVRMIPYYWRELKGLQGTIRRLSAISVMEGEDVTAGEAVCPSKGDLALNGVSFGYNDKPVLSDVSMTIPAGSFVALVGENGAGKTTLVNLLERFYQPKSGTITYAGKDASDISLESWRNLFGYVQQDVRLMGGTIRDNITYGVDREVPDEELQKVCKQVYLDEFLATLPDGVDTAVEDFGDNLSGGQRQKIAIARALLRNAECLLLDEYSSNLDRAAADQVESCVSALRGEKTVIVIAHKISTIQNADQIVVLADHKVQATGTHEQLMETSPVYQQLLQAQMGQ